MIQLNGDIDLAKSPALRERLRHRLQQQTPNLLLDFTKVTYIDSSGLATLIEYFKEAKAFDGRLALASLSPRVQSAFDLVNLSEIFEIHPSVESAKRELAPT